MNSELQTLVSKLHMIRQTIDHMTDIIATHMSKNVSEAPAKFRDASLKFHESLTKEERHAEGIYFTPREIRARLFAILDSLALRPSRILEPSFGTGEFILDASVRYPDAQVTGVEKNKGLFASLPSLSSEGRTLINNDFLAYKSDSVFDLVIGNPPYFVVKDKNPACMTGRGNIFVQFIYKCLVEHMIEGGILAFVLPTSFYNCSYYRPCRDYMRSNCQILHVENVAGDFYDTSQETMIMVVRKTAPLNANYWYTFGGGLYLTPFYKELAALTTGAGTLCGLGFQVKTGDVVWNQHKKKLHATEGTLVIYSSNIVNNTLVLENLLGKEKKQRIKGYEGMPVEGPAILVARGYGNTYRFAYTMVPEGTRFHGENHVNVITPLTSDAKALLPRVMNSLGDPRTEKFISMFVGNGAMSKSELESVLPIF